MDNEQAKLILSTYRPGGEDASDPIYTKALEQVRRDPELGSWFAGQRRFDQSMQQALQTIQPPAGLRDQLLINRRVVRLGEQNQAVRRLWARPTGWLAMAASILVLLGISLFYHPADRQSHAMSEAKYVESIQTLVGDGQVSLGKMASNTGELRTWLAAQGAPHDFLIPPSLRDLEGMGCQTFIVGDAKVSLICFILDKNQMVHLFVIDEAAIINPPGQVPSIIRNGDHIAATWSKAGRTYLLTGMNIDEETLRRLI